MPFDSIEAAIEDVRKGKIVIIADDEDRENEGDLVCAASLISAENVNFMTQYGRGLICVALTPNRTESLGLALMTDRNSDPQGTAFTVSVDAHEKFGVTTGISAQDRSATIKVLADDGSRPEDLRKPGHIFPLRARPGGVLRRVGQTEAAVDIARLAGLPPVGVICEILNPDGTMARRPELEKYAKKHDLKFITVAQLVRYRLAKERLVSRIADAQLPTRFGEFRVIGYRSSMDEREHVALIKGDIEGKDNVLVRMHSECLTGDVFGSLRCDCGEQLSVALERIAKEDAGAVVYVKQAGRGIGLHNKIRAYELQDQGHDTVQANQELGFKPDLRDYGIGAQILLDLGLSNIRLLTNNPRKIIGLEGYNLKITGREPLRVEAGEHNEDYLAVKRSKLGHLL